MVGALTFLLGPIGRWLIVTAVVLGLLAFGYHKVKRIGWNERDTIARQEAEETAKRIKELEARRAEVTEKVVVEYRDRVKVVKQQGEEVIREIEKFIPVGSCELPPGWRMLHDASATGSLPKPSLGTDAAAVTAQDAAETVFANYTVCHDNAERLTALQRWVATQHKLEQ